MATLNIEGLLQSYAKVSSWDQTVAMLDRKRNVITVGPKPSWFRNLFKCDGEPEASSIIKERAVLKTMMLKFQETSQMEGAAQLALLESVDNVYATHIGYFNKKIGAIPTECKINIDEILSQKLKDVRTEQQKPKTPEISPLPQLKAEEDGNAVSDPAAEATVATLVAGTAPATTEVRPAPTISIEKAKKPGPPASAVKKSDPANALSLRDSIGAKFSHLVTRSRELLARRPRIQG